MSSLDFVGGETVVAFRPQMLRARRPIETDMAERGRVLLFTGVRYERLEDGSVHLAATDDTAAEPSDRS